MSIIFKSFMVAEELEAMRGWKGAKNQSRFFRLRSIDTFSVTVPAKSHRRSISIHLSSNAIETFHDGNRPQSKSLVTPRIKIHDELPRFRLFIQTQFQIWNNSKQQSFWCKRRKQCKESQTKMVKWTSAQGKICQEEIRSEILGGDWGNIFSPGFDANSIKHVDLRASNQAWTDAFSQKQFTSNVKNMVTRLIAENNRADAEAADLGVDGKNFAGVHPRFHTLHTLSQPCFDLFILQMKTMMSMRLLKPWNPLVWTTLIRVRLNFQPMLFSTSPPVHLTCTVRLQLRSLKEQCALVSKAVM